MTTDVDLTRKSADTIRFLAADAVQKANSGHPGMPMGMADAAVALFAGFMVHNPTDPTWVNRDRFILSAGHGSMLIYSLLHLTGYSLTIDDLKQFRQLKSKTPGHPENFMTEGVETTTGPLGQGVSNAVGFAIAEAWLAQQYNRPGHTIVDHNTYVIASDGDLQEGVSHEALALAGHLGLGKLIVLYDDNGIQIDGSTDLAFSEDVMARFDAYGWHTQTVENGNDSDAVTAALFAAKAEKDKPSIIACKTTIGFGSPNKGGTSGIHGSPMGDEEIALTKRELGWPVDAKFYVPDDVSDFMSAIDEGATVQAEWQTSFDAYAAEYPELAQAFLDVMAGKLPDGWADQVRTFEEGSKLATRAASGNVLADLVPAVSSLLGGSADLTGSNKTIVKGTGHLAKGDISGRYVYYGVREHGMAAIMNGLALHGGFIPYGGTFLVFSDYMRGGMRLSALMGLQVIYVLTHDSIGLGEDGPTHQPVEHLMALRSIPNLWMARPAEANETAAVWKAAIERRDGPTALALTRQGLPTLAPEVAANAKYGAYAIGASDDDQAAILASGSEVEIAMDAQAMLAAEGIQTRVVSMPIWELFDTQSAEYKERVLPTALTARVSIEAGVTFGWQKYIGTDGVAIGLDSFGASGPYKELYEKFGLTADKVVEAVKSLLG